MENELKPCPNPECDGVPSCVGPYAKRGKQVYDVQCDKCACSIEMPTREQAIAAWNARAGNAVNAGEVERLVDAYGDACTRFGARSVERTAARAALLAYVSKGVDVGKLVEALELDRWVPSVGDKALALCTVVEVGHDGPGEHAASGYYGIHFGEDAEDTVVRRSALMPALAAVTAAKGGR